MTNRQRFQEARDLPRVNVCEFSPGKGKLARLDDPYHADAAVVVGHGGTSLRLCGRCANLSRFRDRT